MAGPNQPVGFLHLDELLLQLLKERFTHHYAVKQGLGENEIPYQKEFDS